MTQLTYFNLCRSCDKDFASVSAFDRHRTGDHELDYPEQEEGRRCRNEQEMIEAEMERDRSGRWRRRHDAYHQTRAGSPQHHEPRQDFYAVGRLLPRAYGLSAIALAM